MLELIMDTISAEVVGRGLQTPLFHVFSETLAPCPSGEAGLFDEFPMWPVGVDKVRALRWGVACITGWRTVAVKFNVRSCPHASFSSFEASCLGVRRFRSFSSRSAG